MHTPLQERMAQRPYLAGIITTDDVSTKGAGNFKADYVNWARIANLLHQHAPDWEFHLRPAPYGSGHIWKAPNDTGYVVGYFTGPNDACTPDFPQAVMDNRNAPVSYEKISARDVTDTHRRCLCTAAAYSFGLAYELWAKEEVENPHRDEAASAPAARTPGRPPAAAKSAPNGTTADLLASLEKLGVTPYGLKTFAAICEVEKLEELSAEKTSKLIKAIGADHVKMFNQGKNSKGSQILPAPIKDQLSADSSIDELAKAADEAFGDD
jgi:hypothetical protein